jgi:long-chain acyl-CoA synthetase
VNLVHELLEAQMRLHPEATFLIDDGERYTFAMVDALADRIAAGLQLGGVGRGDRVALVMANSAALVASQFGVAKAGAVFVALSPETTADRVAFVLDDCGVCAVVADASVRAVVEPAVARSPAVRLTAWSSRPVAGADPLPAGLPAPDGAAFAPPRLIDLDLAAVIYTSGSTGIPKGVMLTHRNLTTTARSIASYLENTPDDIVACVLPMSHGYGLQQVLVGALVGHAVLVERSFAFPMEVMARVAEHRVTGLPGVPSMFSAVLERADKLARLDLSSIRYLTNAAAALPVAFIPRLQVAFPGARVFCMYGLTESSTRVAYLDPGELAARAGSVGKAIPNLDAVVMTPDGRRAAPGEVGELAVRGSSVMLGYWQRPEETARALRPGPLPEQPLLFTGDLFRTDEDGFLYWVGRTDDVFKSRGEMVAPKEVEGALYELEGVAEAAVVGVPHEFDGRAIKAFVVARPGAALDERAVLRHCRSRLPPHLVPRFVEFRPALPRAESGKVIKSDLA